MLLETLSVGLIVPAITLMLQSDFIESYPSLRPLFELAGNPSQYQMITFAMLGLICLYLVKNLFLAFLAWKQTRFAYGVQVQLSQRLFTAYLRQPYTFHLQRNSAQLMRNVTGEVGMFTGVINSALTVFTEGLILLGIAVLLLVVEPLGAFCVVTVLGVAAWAFIKFTRKNTLRWGKARQHHDGLRIQHLQQGLGGAKDVKLLGREKDFLRQYHFHNSESARVAQLQATLQQLPRLWLELLAVTGLALLVLTMLAQGYEMDGVLPILGLFAVAAFRLMPSVNRLLSAMQSLRFTMPVVSTLTEELKACTTASDEGELANISSFPLPLSHEVRLTNVSYRYPGATAMALHDLSIVLQKGESIGIVGPSGSGKSTLVDVMLGLLSPNAGKVTVDGQDIQACLRGWQNQIGYVPQTIYLTDDTLRRNIAFGLPHEQIDDFAVERAIKDSQLEEFVESLPDGVETIVGERGVRLSGGQRQRIGIARALYHNPPVLVLDEATSALDIATEEGVMRAITALKSSKTIIIVAHRLTTVEHCDRLYRLQQGRVVQEGAPSNVLHNTPGLAR